MVLSKTTLVFSCSHADPSSPNDRFSLLGNMIYEIKPDMVIDLGDGADMKSLNTYDTKYPKQVVTQSYEKDIDCYNDAQERLRWKFRHLKRRKPTWIGFEGNHECFQAHTEIFVRGKGWVPAPAVEKGDYVMSLGGVWDKVQETHRLWHEGPMVSYKNQTGEFSVTPNHRVYYYGSFGKIFVKKANETPFELDLPVPVPYGIKRGKFKKHMTDSIKDWVYCITVSGGNFLARQGGVSVYTGNCRIKKAIEVDPRLEGQKLGVSFRHLQTDHWFDEYHEYENGGPAIADYDGVSYAHYFSAGNYGTAVSGLHHAYTLIQNRNHSSTCGHSHKRSLYFKDSAHPNTIIGAVVGHFKGKDETWAGQSNRDWWRGVLVKRNVENGVYDPEWWSYKRIEETFGG